ncbi:MAG: transcriptional regulator GcvA [Alphaproteobacteria bacterium]|nr:transcriptional regulator GcvA [Alphaproteobacteria bacterium]
MAPKLPPLPALRAFAVAARHLSFKQAAAELHVTPGAISQQIKALEQALGVALFQRFNRRLQLTPAGAAYLPSITAAFEEIAGATSRLTASQALLQVSAPPSFAARWLLPRLDRFRARHPGTELAIEATMGLTNFRDDNIDVAIRYGRGRYAGLRSDRLFPVRLVPVCSPTVLHGRSAAAKRAAFASLPLLHDKARRNWRVWLAAQDDDAVVDAVDPERGPSFSDQTFMLQAAALGQGIALAPDALVADDVAAGRLIKLSDAGWPTHSAYWCVTPDAPREDRRITAFRTWLLDEAARANA